MQSKMSKDNNSNQNNILNSIVDDHETHNHLKAMWEGQSNVLVAVRIRPLMKHDVVKKSCVRALDTKVVVIMDPAQGDKQDILRANRSREKQYAFDYVFDPNCNQETIYNSTTKFLIHGVLDGYNATVFAYGQTGSGKTHTMIGSQTDPGIMVRVMEDLFTHSSKQGKQQGVQYKVNVSFLEVYNENIRDLLSDVEEYLDLREDPIKGPVVASITEIETNSSKEIMQLLLQGNAKRSQAATAANEVSSRSHAVLQVTVECRDRAPGTVANIKVGKLSLVDLAGSERAANTKNVGQRLVEGANINRSLLALGNCINALGEKGNKGNFVPYRDSKLTRLLKDSLGGNCRTVMIANISSAESSFEETLNTLKYANRAKNIKTNVQRNVLNVNYHISEYVELINNLRSEIQLLKNQIGTAPVDKPPGTTSSLEKGNFHADNVPVNVINSPFPNAPNGSTTPFQALRESLRSGPLGEGREYVNNMREKIVDNFQERMQLRRSLIELEDQNVQNSIEVSKRQLMVVQWAEKHGNFFKTMHMDNNGGADNLTKADFSAYIMSNGSPEVLEAWQECEQLRKAIIKNNGMKKNISKRLKYNEKEAEKFRDDLGKNITGEDRRELMALQYQVGRLELENMELEQHRIVHESILKGKDLIIQKLQLQLAVRNKLITRQQLVLKEYNLDHKIGYDSLALLEDSLMLGNDFGSSGPPSATINDSMEIVPPSPLRNVEEMMNNNRFDDDRFSDLGGRGGKKIIPKLNITSSTNNSSNPHLNTKSTIQTLLVDDDEDEQTAGIAVNNKGKGPSQPDDDYEDDLIYTEREIALTARDRDFIEQGEWSEIQSELSDHSFTFGSNDKNNNNAGNNRKKHHHHHGHHKKNQKKDKDNELNNSGSKQNVNGNKSDNNKPQVVNAINSTPTNGNNAIHGPRGGRIYRSAANNMNSDEPSNSQKKRNSNAGNNSNSGDYMILENSDDDSIVSQPHMESKYKHYSPRANNKDLPGGNRGDPLPSVNGNGDDNIQVLSGRRNDVSPRAVVNNDVVIYPSLTPTNSSTNTKQGNNKPLEKLKIEVPFSNNNKPSKEEDFIILEDRKAPLAKGLSKLGKASSQEEDDLYSDFTVENPNAPGGGGGLMIKSKPIIGNKPLLSKLKSKNSADNLNADINLNNNNAAPIAPAAGGDLNIMGNGIEGFSNINGPRPANNRVKPSLRAGKVIQKSILNPSSSENDNISAENIANSGNNNGGQLGLDGAAFNLRMKSLPTLNKQASAQSVPNSARNNNDR